MFPTTPESTPPAEEIPTPVEADDKQLEIHLEHLLDTMDTDNQFHPDYQTRQAVINFLQEHQDENILHGDIITWYQEETNWADISQDHIRHTVRYMLYQEDTLQITEPVLPDFDENIITLTHKHLQQTATIIIDDDEAAQHRATQSTPQTASNSGAPTSWPKPPDHHTLIPIQPQVGYPGSETHDDESADAMLMEQETPVTPRDGISFHMAEGTTPEHVSSHEHCQHYPNWSAQAAPTAAIPVLDIPHFPLPTEDKQTRRTSRGPYGTDTSPPRTAEQGHPSGRHRAL